MVEFNAVLNGSAHLDIIELDCSDYKVLNKRF